MLNIKKNQIGIFYLIYPYEYASEDLDIYKFGVHQNLTIEMWYKRFNKYRYKSEIIIYFKINNLYENENKVKDYINNNNFKYKNGVEYFTGDLKYIYDNIYEIIKDDIIETYDLDNDILNDQFRKINIYFDKNFNSKYLDFLQNKFNEQNILNNHHYRDINLRYLLIDYKNILIINNKKLNYNNSDKVDLVTIFNYFDDETKLNNKESNKLIKNNLNKDNSNEDNSNQYNLNQDNKNEYNLNQNNVNEDNSNQDNTNEDNKNEDNSNNDLIIKLNNEIINKDNNVELYICHHCIDYKTNMLSDMYKHFKRKNKCKLSTSYSYEEAKILTKKKKYIFNFDIFNLNKNDYLFIITHYNEKKNYINKNYKINIFNKNIDNFDVKYEDDLNTFLEKIGNDLLENQNDMENRKCLLCEQIFSTRSNLIRHLQNSKTGCKRKRLEKILFNKMHEEAKLKNIIL